MSRFEVYGSEESNRTIVALPALGERKEIYKILSRYLKDHKVIAIDLPGHNQVKQTDYTISSFVVEIEEILKQLNISSAHFMGNSIGGWIIQAFYTKFPSYVESLTLLDGGYFFPGETENSDEEIQLPVIEHLEELENAIKEMTDAMKGLTEENRLLFNHYLRNNFLLKEGVYVHHGNEKALNTLSEEVTIKNYCIEEDINIPFMLVLAEQDMTDFSKSKAETFKQLHPHSSIVRISNGYHFLPVTNPMQVAEALQEHILTISTNRI